MIENGPILQSKLTIISWLKTFAELSHTDIIENHPSKLAIKPPLPLKKPLIAIGRASATPVALGLGNYIGEYPNDIAETVTERRGKQLAIRFDVYIFNGIEANQGGEREIERIQAALMGIFNLEALPTGIQFTNFEARDIDRDPKEDLYMCRCILSVTTLVYKDTTSEMLKEFQIQGGVINE